MAKIAASSGRSIMAGAAPTASSTLAVISGTTVLVMQCTSGVEDRTAPRMAVVVAASAWVGEEGVGMVMRGGSLR